MTAQPASSPHPDAIAEPASAICARIFEAIACGDITAFETVIHPKAVNREAITQPRQARRPGPAGFHATALWLRSALADMTWDIHEVVADGDLVVAHTTAHGRQVGPFVFYNADGGIDQAFPSKGRTCSVTQTHWFRIVEGQVIEHWANRDDVGTARQLGWIPPSPGYLARMALANRRARYQASE
jgi:predicted ester cyclase